MWISRLLISGLRVIVIAYVVAVAALWLLGNRLMFMPPRPTYRSLPGLVRIPLQGDTLAAVWLPKATVRARRPASPPLAPQGACPLPYREEWCRRGPTPCGRP